jgi:LysR family nitrogen assimilation transcriptional regulator
MRGVPMELRQLRYFACVAKLGSYSRASTNLRVAQSALSRQIRMLEEEFDQILLYRTGRGATPTPAGELLLDRATGLLAQVDALKADISAADDVKGTVRLGVPAAFSGALATRILERCEVECPGICVQIYEGLSSTLLEWLLDGRVDLAVLYQHQVVHRPLEVTNINTQPMRLVHAPHIMPSDGELVGLRAIAQLPLIILERPNGSRLMIDDAFAKAGIAPHATTEVSAWLLLKELLLAGKGFALLTTAEVQEEVCSGRLVATPLASPQILRTLCIARNPSKGKHRASNEIFRLIERHNGLWNAQDCGFVNGGAERPR